MATANGEKRKRAPQRPKPMFVLYEGSGDITVLKATRDAAEALEIMDGNPNAHYVKVDPPVSRRAAAE